MSRNRWVTPPCLFFSRWNVRGRIFEIKARGVNCCRKRSCQCSDVEQAWERECGREWSRKKGQDDPGCGWKICEWEVSGHAHQQEPFEKSSSKQTQYTTGLGGMFLSSSSGGLTFLLTKMIRGNLWLILWGRKIWYLVKLTNYQPTVDKHRLLIRSYW
jgi:hypothetical protein